MKHHTIACIVQASALWVRSRCPGTNRLPHCGARWQGHVLRQTPRIRRTRQGYQNWRGCQRTAAGGSGLPFELRQVASKYPVTLYTAPQCAPCDAGRSMLTARGVPFTERTVSTQKMIAQFNKQMGDSSLPVLNVGGSGSKASRNR
jgi:glutaredoxin